MARREKLRPRQRRWRGVAAVTAAARRLRKGASASGGAADKPRDAGPDLALAERSALIAAGWTLVERFERDGKHYVLVERNDPAAFGFESLTARERQALDLAARGHSNKCIAYEMGITASTVSVLLVRAARKLGTSSRMELIETYLRLNLLTR